jgi:hypothetical protein
MRLFILAATAGVMAVSAAVVSPGPAAADKSRMGCDTATEVWDAALGKCAPGTPKYKRRSAEPVKTAADAKKAPAPKKAAAAKKAPAAKKTPAAQ